MPKHTQFVRPKIRCESGRKAYVEWLGKKYYLGPWKGEPEPYSEAVTRKWLRLCNKLEIAWEAQKRGLKADPRKLDKVSKALFTVREGYEAWLDSLRDPEDGNYNEREPGGGASFQHSVQDPRPLLS